MIDKRKIWSVVLVVLMLAIGLVACNGDGDDEADPDVTPGPTELKQTDEALDKAAADANVPSNRELAEWEAVLREEYEWLLGIAQASDPGALWPQAEECRFPEFENKSQFITEPGRRRDATAGLIVNELEGAENQIDNGRIAWAAFCSGQADRVEATANVLRRLEGVEQTLDETKAIIEGRMG
ncbi:MAG: hypothetical protein GYB65_16370 [Chloroflexi bacterium]|nr:hypothetical protein [Chloroflexota bacterium]